MSRDGFWENSALLHAIALSLTCIICSTSAIASINVELRPVEQAVIIGDLVELGLYAVSDSQEDQLFAAAQVIIAWDPLFLQLLGIDDTGAVGLLSSSFPFNDPYNLNELVPPQDGDGIYVALAPLGNPIAATQEGTLLTTFQFTALATTAFTLVDILESGGKPQGETIIFDGTIPNLDVTGSLSGADIEIIPQGDAVQLTLHIVSELPILKGDFVEIAVTMSNLGKAEAAGFQAFLEFDLTELSFIYGHYIIKPFGQLIIYPIIADGNQLDMASGVDVPGGQVPTSEDATLVILKFEALEAGCVSSLQFRDHDPPSRLTDDLGNSIVPLHLAGMLSDPRSADFNGDGIVSTVDLLELFANWGPCPSNAQCPTDLDCSGNVSTSDLLILFANWGPV